MGATLIQLKLAEYGHIAKNADDKLPKKVVKNWEVLILLQRAPLAWCGEHAEEAVEEAYQLMFAFSWRLK